MVHAFPSLDAVARAFRTFRGLIGHSRHAHADGVGHGIADRRGRRNGRRLADPDDAAALDLRGSYARTMISGISAAPASLYNSMSGLSIVPVVGSTTRSSKSP